MANQNELQTAKKNIVDQVADKVKKFQADGDIKFPPGYSPENAMKSAWLMLQDVKTGKASGYKPALEVASKTSIANALLDMVVQGLNPMKKQGYFLMYGQNLVFQRSYFGTMAVTKRATGAKSIDALTIHEGDNVEYEIENGRVINLKHKQSFGNTNKPIIGAYCTIVEKDGGIYTEVMTMEEIEKSWKQSKNDSTSKDSTHQKFKMEMTKRTVINRACKRFLNSSDDSNLLTELIVKNDENVFEAETAAEIEENANGEYIDFDEVEENAEPVEAEFVEVSNGQKADVATGEIFDNVQTEEEDAPPF